MCREAPGVLPTPSSSHRSPAGNPGRPRAARQWPPPNPAQAMKSSPLGSWEAWLPLTPDCHSHPPWSSKCAGTKYKSRPQQPVSGSSGCTKNKVCRTGWLHVDSVSWSLKVPSGVMTSLFCCFPQFQQKQMHAQGKLMSQVCLFFTKRRSLEEQGARPFLLRHVGTRDRQP